MKEMMVSHKTVFCPEHETLSGLKYMRGKAVCFLQTQVHSTMEGDKAFRRRFSNLW